MSDWSDDETPTAVGDSGSNARKSNEAQMDKDGSNACRKCHKEGHMAKDCELPDTCRKCHKEGHMARDCELPDTCRKCKQEGHMAKDCDLPDTCRRCNQEGHMVADCTQPEETRTVVGADGEEREIYVPKTESDEQLFDDTNTISAGINFKDYKNIPVEVKGENVPASIKSFEASGLRPLILENVKKSDFEIPTPIQQNSIPIVMAKRDMIACAQTGSGKTAAFLLPIIHNIMQDGLSCNSGSAEARPQAVILAPTRELAVQINTQARKFSMGSTCKSVVAYGGTSVGYQKSQLQKGCNILVATPGRLLDFVEKGVVSFASLQYFVLDEADRMIDMGFMPDIEKCMASPDMPSTTNRNTLMLSATFPEEVQSNARKFMRKDKIFVTIGMVGGTCKDVQQDFISVKKAEKKKNLDKILNDEERDPTERVLIFVNTKKTADFLATHLSQHELPSTSIQGDRKQREREEALDDFKKGKRPILVATAVAARGLDIPYVAKVINYDMPKDVDEYVHRIGRTGRVGNLGRAISFYDCENDQEVCNQLVNKLAQCGVEVPDFMSEGSSAAVDDGNDEEDW